MKNILIVDGAINCAYDIFSVDYESFDKLFPEKNQNIEFIEDINLRKDAKTLSNILAKMWDCPVKKESVHGIHGIIFYRLEAKRQFYPTKADSDLDYIGRNFSVKNL